jgi:ADP-ribose pyrophosphatase
MPGMMTAQTDVVMWRGPEHVGEPTDTEEAGRLEWVSADRARELLKNRGLLGAGTIIAVQSWLLSRATSRAGGQD